MHLHTQRQSLLILTTVTFCYNGGLMEACEHEFVSGDSQRRFLDCASDSVFRFLRIGTVLFC